MKSVNLQLELRVLRTITNTRSQKECSRLFAAVNADCFYTKSGKAIYSRIYTLMRERGELVGWGELKVDPVIPEIVREKVTDFKEKPIPSDKIDRAISILHKYRRIRSMIALSQHIVRRVNEKHVDIDQLTEETSKMIMENRAGQNVDSWFIHVGAKDGSDIKAVQKLLEYDPRRFIPTGLQAFDSVNFGIPRGSLWLIAGSTGSGKSVFVGQMAHNMARSGAKVCVVPLEMKNDEMLQRELSRLNTIEMQRLLDPRKLSKMEKENIVSRYERFSKKIRQMGGLLSLYAPEDDMTAEEILFGLKMFGYDVVLIDYIGLLKGVDGDDQWRAMRNVTRFAKRFASMNDMVIGVCAQLSDEGIIRYAKGMVEDASNAFFFHASDTTRETGVMWIDQKKARNQKKFRFPVSINYEMMQISDLSEEQKAAIDEKEDKKANKKSKGFKKSKGTSNNSTFDFDSDE
jgi:replicative DNA helicase